MLANTLIFIVAAIHIYILILEMFLWESKTGRKAFSLSANFARETRVMAANQGLYNCFLRDHCRTVRRRNRQSENTVCAGSPGNGGADSAVRQLALTPAKRADRP